ncbi:hypothetical protein E0K99_04505 [Faecalicoccus pleomorphus]|uniref:hypothetical protein n=1 Tax=Faecalicoccus pleomorphus TaxID=1323 RepID=UPI0014304D54|nr:hypothetical protein [Faecalicoccus pleomorphus]NJE40585.1 hypothetical protein [Faecalicoccus pleomorphus]
MKKILLLFEALALCGCSVNEAEPPISGDEIQLKINDDNDSFSVTVPNLEIMLNYRFKENDSEFKDSSFKESSDKFVYKYNDDINIEVTTNEDDEVNKITFATYGLEDTQAAKEMGSISTIVLSDIMSQSNMETLNDNAIEMYNNCLYGSEMHGSAVSNRLLENIDFIYYEDETSDFIVSFEPTTYIYNTEYQRSTDFNKYIQTYCPSYTVEGQQETEESQDATKTEETQEQPAKQTTYYGPGMYKVGVDIPAGEYNVKAEVGELGYLEVSSDPNGTSIITNDAFENNSYISISDGQYLKLESCYISQ